MSTLDRREQALEEVGRTAVGRPAAAVLAGAFLLTVAAVPLGQAAADLSAGELPFPALRQLAARVPEALTTAAAAGLRAANRQLLDAIEAAEDRLEDDSLLRRRLLPPAQAVLTRVFGVGNEQAYPGRDDWLFYRADVDHVVGPPFLDPRLLRRRARGGDAWRPAPQPDPLPALVAFHRRLAERGVELVVLPTPVKPMIHPERFSARFASRRGAAGAAVRNPSFEELARRLEEAGVALLDVADGLAAESARRGEPLYLRTDTHWTPEGLDFAAAELAAFLERRVGGWRQPAAVYLERRAAIDHQGDVAAMLRLPEGSGAYGPERAIVGRVLTPRGRPWQPDPEAEVLLLGDSFANIYSEPGLGWGTGGGLAERLSFHLGRPVDRIALNAGGAYASRQALARELASGRDRLAGKRVVVYQFAARELSQGDWRVAE